MNSTAVKIYYSEYIEIVLLIQVLFNKVLQYEFKRPKSGPGPSFPAIIPQICRKA